MMDDATIEQLAAMLAGDLEEEDARSLRDRLAGTDEGGAALAEFEQIASFLREEQAAEPPASLVKRAKKVLRQNRPGVADRLKDGVRSFLAALDFDSRLSPAVAGFRGVAEVAQVAFSAEPCELDLEIQPGEGETSSVRGQIAADQPDGWTLRFTDSAGHEAAEIEAGPDGSFRIDLAPGSYTITLERGTIRVEAGPLPLP